MAKFLPEACQTFLKNLSQIQLKAKNFDPASVEGLMQKTFDEGLKGHKPNILSMFNEFVINGMLSGTGTPIANALSGVIQTVMIPSLNVIKSIPKGSAARREALAAFSALKDGWASNMAFFRGGFKSGVPFDFELSPRALGVSQKEFKALMEQAQIPTDVDGNVDPKVMSQFLGEAYDYVTKAIPGPIGNFIRIPTRITVAADEYFKAQLRSQKSLALISRKASIDEAAGRGDYDTLYNAYKKEVFGEGDPKGLLPRLEKLFDGQDDFATAIADVRNYATDGTFQTKLTGMLQRLQNVKGEGRSLKETAVIQAVPFFRTPWNILKEGASYTPGLGFLLTPGKTKAVANNIDGKWVVKNEVVKMPLEDLVARQLVGFGIVVSIIEMFKAGMITGSIPEDPAERERWKANGIQPNSIKLGDSWVSYSRAEPFATVLGITSDILEFNKRVENGEIREGEFATQAEKAMWASLKANILQKSFMQGFADAVAVADSPEGAKAFGESLAKRVVPAISNTVARALDGQEREAVTTMEKMMQRVPGWREELPVQYNKYSPDGELEPAETNLMQAVTGVAVRKEPTDFQKKMNQLGVAFAPAKRKMGTVELSAEQYSYYKQKTNEIASRVFKENIDAWLANPERAVVRKVIESRVMANINKAAKAQLMMKYPELQREVMLDNLEERGIDITKLQGLQ